MKHVLILLFKLSGLFKLLKNLKVEVTFDVISGLQIFCFLFHYSLDGRVVVLLIKDH